MRVKNKCEIVFHVGNDGDVVQLSFEAIPVSKIEVVFPESQRGITYESRLKELASKWDWTLCEPLTVFGPDENGVYHVAEGNHRARVIADIFDDEQRAPCRVFPATNPKEAARVFLELSKKKRITKIQSFNVAASAGYEIEAKAKQIAEEFSYQIGASTAEGKVNAVGALTKCLEDHGEEILRRAIWIIRAAFGGEKNAMSQPILTGMCLFFARADKTIDRVKLVERLREIKGRSAAVYNDIKYAKSRVGSSETLAECGMKHIASIYNKGLSANKVSIDPK